YFAWRYGERGRAFGRSDAGYLVTLLGHDEEAARRLVAWLARLLAPRGMPSLLVEYQLDSLGRALRRANLSGASRLRGWAAELRRGRLGAVDAVAMEVCERTCRDAAEGIRQRRGAGTLIAAAVADRALGYGEYDVALVRWLSDAEPKHAAWSSACAVAHAHALASLRVTVPAR
ncbi:MAG: hypothetical protein WCJ30_16935, partial [Deltaproteobacteria bacterium]